jgi:hypothetical protein
MPSPSTCSILFLAKGLLAHARRHRPVCAIAQTFTFNMLSFPMVDLGEVGPRWVRRKGRVIGGDEESHAPNFVRRRRSISHHATRQRPFALIPGDLRYGRAAQSS